MKNNTVTISELKANFDEALSKVKKGQRIYVTEEDRSLFCIMRPVDGDSDITPSDPAEPKPDSNSPDNLSGVT